MTALNKKFKGLLLRFKKTKLYSSLRKFVNTPSKLIIAVTSCSFVLLVAVVGGLIVSLVNPAEIDLKDFVIVQEIGYDGYGTLSAEIDYAKLINECAEKSKSGRQQSNYDKAMSIVKKERLFAVVIKEKDYANGEETKLLFRKSGPTYREIEKIFNIRIGFSGMKYKVSKLSPVADYDPFDDLVVSTNNTVSGKGEISFSIEHESNRGAWKWDVVHSGDDGTISNGDVLHLVILGVPEQDVFTKKYGLKVSRESIDYVVDSLNEIPTTSSVFNYDDTDVVNAVDSVAKEWIVDGLNDESNKKYERIINVCGRVFLTDRKDGKLGNRLCYIYEVSEPENNLTYYTFLSPNKMYLINNKTNKLVAAGEDKTPTSLVYYHKETARWSPRFGWGDYVDQGFSFDSRAYAGHKTIKDEINYLTKQYEGTYNKILLSDELTQKMEG